MSSCCLDLSDIELLFGRVTGVDVTFDLTGFNPSAGDYYLIIDGVAYLIHGGGGGTPITDPDGNVITDPDGNIIYAT